ncbi:MAG: hypothetical protein NTZ73_01250 [Candidatus Diapherotrites archaeon]|nr:hypothetical protein [Candidatus Diapherotrites archaeon]
MTYFGRDEGGQAALTDSLFFLAIVSMICTLLFYFLINYGATVEEQINSFYSGDFAMDTLKVIAYVNVMRDGTSIYSLTGDNPQYDYLLAMIKEDYAESSGNQNPSLNSATRKAIANTVHSVMKPFEHSVDYAFYLFQEDSQKFLFLLMGVHECKKSGTECEKDSSGNIVGSERRMYYCIPASPGILKDKVFPYVGKVDSATSKVFLDKGTSKDLSAVTGVGANYIMSLDLWISKDVNNLWGLDSAANKADFNCALIPKTDYE